VKWKNDLVYMRQLITLLDIELTIGLTWFSSVKDEFRFMWE